MNTLDDEYWSDRYKNQQAGWDLGQVSPPIKAYVDQLTNKAMRILIPGCGNAHEAAYLLAAGFTNITLIDIAAEPVRNLERTFAMEIEQGHLAVYHADFFDFSGNFDLILEQTFFCAIDPALRSAYALQMQNLLTDNGKLVGLLFEMENPDGPPFGGNKKEYFSYFDKPFDILKMEPCYNSIAPRAGRELFVIFQKKHAFEKI